MEKDQLRSILIWGAGFPCYLLIGELLDGFTFEAFYTVRLILFFVFVLVISSLYYINIKLREKNYGLEINIFWRWTERYIPFVFAFPIMAFFFSFFVIGLTYMPRVAPFNYFINYCLGLFPFYLLVFINDLSIYLDHLEELWGSRARARQ